VASVAHSHEHDHAGHPPAAHKSSRVDARLLGMYLFIGSETMLFGSFFSAYFFARVVVGGDGSWPPEGYELPVYLA
jgi:heme/copper-type cytochrome/quinol oxidase subunit 3